MLLLSYSSFLYQILDSHYLQKGCSVRFLSGVTAIENEYDMYKLS